MSSKDKNTEPSVKGCFIPSFTEQIVPEKLICHRHRSRGWEYRGSKTKSSPTGSSLLENNTIK